MKKVFVSIILAAALGIGVSVLKAESVAAPESGDSPRSEGRYISQDDFTRTAEQTVNGVVSVKSYATPRRQQQYQSYNVDPFYEFFFGSPGGRRVQPQPQQPERQQQIGLGSGVIISHDGYIVTNNHVVADAERLEVTLNDNRNFQASVVGTDPATDLALIKIEAPDLHVIPMGNSEDLRVGEWVLAVGNPFGFTSSVTSGIVSAKARDISRMTGSPSRGGIEAYIQTDAALNSGNSGGALVNLSGELVGINTAIYSQTGTYAGCSFAIPTSIVRKVSEDLRQYGTVQRAVLGISLTDVTPELVEAEGIEGTVSGAFVAGIAERSAASEAQLEKGDVIVAIDNRPVRTGAELQEAIAAHSPGDEITIHYYREGKRRTATVALRNSRGDTRLNTPESDNPLGAALAAIDAEAARRLEIRSGVAVASLDPDGRFAMAGIREGFIIRNINGTQVKSPEDVNAIYRALNSANNISDRVMFITGLYPSGKAAYYAVPLDD